MKNSKRNTINLTSAKILAIFDGKCHRQIKNDYRELQDYTKKGWYIYAIIDEGIFFFINNRDEDGADWCKIAFEDFK